MEQPIENKQNNQNITPKKHLGNLPPIILPGNPNLEVQQSKKKIENISKHTSQQSQKANEPHQYSLLLGLIGCFGGLFVQLVIGSLYQWGIINIYVTSYYKLSDPDVSLQKNAVVFPTMYICIGITMRLGIWISDKTHPLFVSFSTTLLMSLSIFLSSFMHNFVAFIIFYGVIFGLIAGTGFMIPIVQCNKYLVGRKMMVNGIILIGTGLGSLVFGLFSYNYLNPEKLQPSHGYYVGYPQLQHVASKTPSCLRYLSIFYIFFGLLGCFMLIPITILNRRRQNMQKEEMKRELQKKKQTTQNQEEAANQNQEVEPVQKGTAQSVFTACTSHLWWIKVVINILGSCGVFLINGNYKTYVKQSISDDQFLTTIGVVASVGNGFSRFLWNMLFSKTGYKTVMLLNLSINIFVFVTIRFTVNSPILYLILVFCTNCCLGGFLVKTPTFLQALFGHKVGSNAYGFYWTIFGISNMISYGYVAGLSPLIGFDGVIYICLGMCILAIPFVIFTYFRGHWENDTQHLGYCSCFWSKAVSPQSEQAAVQEVSLQNMSLVADQQQQNKGTNKKQQNTN